MKLASWPELGQLTYCTNIHKGETWPEVLTALRQNLPAIRTATAGDAPFGIGLRLSAAAARDLEAPAALEEFRAFLREQDAYVFTINGFPYGAFHDVPVKQNVYAPDWADPARLAYTNALANLLAALLPEGMDGSVSTVPGTFGAWAEGRVDLIVDNLLRHAAHLIGLHRRTGRLVRLALEPEPACLLETIEEAVDFFTRHLFGAAAAARLAHLAGVNLEEARAALPEHLGLCYDVCHAAVEFEDARGSLDLLRERGVPVHKLQLSSALRIASVDSGTRELLDPFNEPTYLHQVVGRRDREINRWTDLGAALADIDRALGSEWRVHFHVPVFLEEMERFGTTQAFLRKILRLHRERPISAHLEVETYTWDVLPEAYRNVSASAAIARELNWVLAELQL